MDKKAHDKGIKNRKAVLGEAYVANALKNADVDSFRIAREGFAEIDKD